MAANRKKGKKSQSSNQGKSSNKKPATESVASASDNAVAEVAEPVSVDWDTGAQTTSETTTPASSADNGSTTIEEGSSGVSIEATAEPSSSAQPESRIASETNDSSSGDSEAAKAEAETAIEAEVKSEAEAQTKAPAQSEAPADADSGSATDVSAADATSQSPSSATDVAETPSTGTSSNVGIAEKSEVKLSESTVQESKTPHQTLAREEAPKLDVNFAKDEIRTLLVPVPPFNRLIACIIVIFSSSILGYIILKTPAGLNAQGMHTIDLPEAGGYVFFFRGDTQDAYGWGEHGRFRESLEIDMEPVESYQQVEKIEPIKDLSGAGFFSVAEFEVNQPGKYNVWIKWNDPNAKCIGKIRYEKDPVETFFFKWALGIVGTIAFFYMLGIPMTTRKAQSTLPSASPPVVAK